MIRANRSGPVITENLTAQIGSTGNRSVLTIILSLIPGLSQFFRKKFILGLVFLLPFIFLIFSLYFLISNNPLEIILNYNSFVSFQIMIFSILGLVVASIVETLYYLYRNVSVKYTKTFYSLSIFNILIVFSLIFTFAWASFPQSFLLKNSFEPNTDNLFSLNNSTNNDFSGFTYSLTNKESPNQSTAVSADPPSGEEVVLPDLAFDDDRINILLIGGDAGPGRYGLRADSLNVVSIDPASRKATIIGIPRNLGNAPLPEGPLKDKMPNGFNNIINALYGWGHSNKNLVNKTLGKSKDPGATVLAASISEFTGLNITGWALVDMGGFIEVIDALGGVDVYVPKETKAAGAVADSKHKVKRFFAEGWNRLNGTRALSYTRTRSQDSDYSRMQRQRCVLASIAAQNKPLDLLLAWPSISKVLQNNVNTNLTSEEIQSLIVLAGLPSKDIKMLSLTPPLVPGFGWDALEVRNIVQDSINNAPKEQSSSNKAASVKQSCKTIRK